LDIHYYQLH